MTDTPTPQLPPPAPWHYGGQPMSAWTPQPAPKKRRRRWPWIVGGLVAVLVVPPFAYGFAAGVSDAAQPTPHTTPATAATIPCGSNNCSAATKPHTTTTPDLPPIARWILANGDEVIAVSNWMSEGMGRIADDIGAGDLAGARIECQLLADRTLATTTDPAALDPDAPANYTDMLNDYYLGLSLCAEGDYGTASTAFDAGTAANTQLQDEMQRFIDG